MSTKKGRSFTLSETRLTLYGLILSLALGVYNIWDTRVKERNKNIGEALQAINDNVKELISIQLELSNASRGISSKLTIRQNTLLTTLQERIKPIEDKVNAHTFIFIGQELLSVGDFEEAKENFSAALNKIKPRDFETRGSLYGDLATIALIEGDSTARNKYREMQITELKKLRDLDRDFVLGTAFEAAGLTELDYGYLDEGNAKIDSAILYFLRSGSPGISEIIADVEVQALVANFASGNYHYPLNIETVQRYSRLELNQLNTSQSYGFNSADALDFLRFAKIDSVHQLHHFIQPSFLAKLERSPSTLGILDILKMAVLDSVPEAYLEYHDLAFSRLNEIERHFANDQR